MPRLLLLLILTLAAGALLDALPSRPARAAFPGAAINVNTTTDELNADGDCSLREAIQAANTDTAVDACPAGSGADTIAVPAGTYTLSIPGAREDANVTGDLDITSDLTINGAGAIIQACDSSAGPCTGIDRLFQIVHSGGLSRTVTISGVTIRNGHTESGDYGGGGIFNSGTLTLTNSTVSGNTAGSNGGGSGGGLYNDYGGTLTVTNSTVSGNTAARYGGGIFSDYGTLTVTNSTVSDNSAYAPPGAFNSYGGGIFSDSATTLKDTIVANNVSGGNCGAIFSLGHNLSTDDTCNLDGAGDLYATAPLLGPLADNGGPTQTHALLAGSPAIDAGSGDCPPPATDQRGFPRPQDGDGNGSAICDIGAFEAPGPVAPTPTLADTSTQTPAATRTPTPTAGGAVGDVDCNHTVNSIDAVLILQYGAGLLHLLQCPQEADTNHDGHINSIDAALILQYVAGLLHNLS